MSSINFIINFINVMNILSNILINIYNSTIFPSLASAAIAAIITAVINYIFNIRPVNQRRKEMELEKILTPLLKQYFIIIKRQYANIDKLVSVSIFNEINKIFNENSIWYFVSDKNIKRRLVSIKKYSFDRNEQQLKLELDKLYIYLENLHIYK